MVTPMVSPRRMLLIAALLVAALSSFGSATAAVHHVPSYGGGGHGGHGGHDGGHGGGYYGGYYPAYGYYGYYGYYGPYAYGYYGPYAYGYPYPAEAPDYGIIDCDVDPEEAKVYLDGERLGEADEFDGFPQYLTVPTGHHIVEFRRHGYQTLRLEVEVKPGAYYDVDRRLHPGDINGKPWIEYWGEKPRAHEPEDDADAPPPPRTHHYNEKPKAPKPADSNGDQGDPSDDSGTPESSKAEAGNPPPRP